MKNLKWMYLFLAIGCEICALLSTTIFSTLMSSISAGIWFTIFYLEMKRGRNNE